MSRFYVFATQADADAATASIEKRARTVYGQHGYIVEADGAVIGKNAATGLDGAGRTRKWDAPRQRADGLWVVAHSETCPGSARIVDPVTGAPAPAGVTVAEYVAAETTASVEIYADAWFPPPPREMP